MPSIGISVSNIQGRLGKGGNRWFVGNSEPDPLLGNNGDYYLEQGNGGLYEKSSGIWNSIGTLGGQGTSFYFNPGLPTPSLGVDDDVYLDTDSGHIYQKSGSVWVLEYSPSNVGFEARYTENLF